jgi:dienelactone hydrolase
MKYVIFIILSFLTVSFSGQNISNNELNQDLLRSLDKQYKLRKSSLQTALKSEKNLKDYQNLCRERYLNLISAKSIYSGNSLLSADSISYIACDNYRICKLILNKEITCNLYVPKVVGQKPAILFFCGHEMTSKSTESYQKMAILLANYGFMVLVIDPIGQGERVQLTDSTGQNLTRGSTTEHTLLNMGLGLTGLSIAQIELMNNKVCLDYLFTRTDVDTSRIGCMGNSGGGAQTTYFSAMEPRIKAVACCSWFTRREEMFNKFGPDDGCQYLWNEGAEGLDIPDYYIMQAPRPTLILAGEKDFIHYKGTLEGFKELKQVYHILDKEENLFFFSDSTGHGISDMKRLAAVHFFKKIFSPDCFLVRDINNYTIQTDSALRCTKKGQIAFEVNNDIAYKEFLSLAVNRKEFSLAKLDSNRVLIRKLLNIQQKTFNFKVKKANNPIQIPYGTKYQLTLERSENTDIPLLVLVPTKEKPDREVFIILHDSGMVKAETLPVVSKILQAGNIVLLTDLSGIGETKDNPVMNNKKFYSEDYRNAALSLFLGKPLLGQRVEDILSIIDYIKTDTTFYGKPVKAINIFSFGNIGVAAQHAYYLDDRIQHPAYKDCILSWKEIITNPLEKNRMSLSVWKALEYYDLGDLHLRIK